MKPTTEQLAQIAALYFEHSICPRIEWKKIDDCLGCADKGSNAIYLNRDIPLGCEGCKVGSGLLYEPEVNLALKEGEQYFFVLLHEIGHFKEDELWQPPREWFRIKKRLEAEYPGELEMQIYAGAGYLTPEQDEDEESFLGRMDDLECWLAGRAASQHIVVQDWAIHEFLQHRAEIREILGLLG